MRLGEMTWEGLATMLMMMENVNARVPTVLLPPERIAA